MTKASSLAEGDHAMVHGRCSGDGRPAAWTGAYILGIEDGLPAGHRDVSRDEGTRSDSTGRLPMFGVALPA